jgi:transposase
MVLYAVSYEKAVSDRPFRCSVVPFAIVPAHPKGPGKTSYPLLTRCFRLHLLRAKKRLPLAAFAPRLPSLVFRLLPFQEIPIERLVAPHPQSPALDREEEGEQGSSTNSGHHGLPEREPRLKKIWADGAYTGEKLAEWCKEQGEWELEIVERSSSADSEGFVVLPHRWIVERTLGWLMRNRRLSKDYERLVQTSETFIEVAMVRLILRRLGRGA